MTDAERIFQQLNAQARHRQLVKALLVLVELEAITEAQAEEIETQFKAKAQEGQP